MLEALPGTFPATRRALARVATHVVARSRQQATARFGLRVTPGGFGTPDLGEDVVRVRVAGTTLVHETAPPASARTRTLDLDGATLRAAADLVGVDLDAPLSVGHDTPPLGDPDEPMALEAASAAALAEWFDLVARALDRTVAAVHADAAPSTVQLWPEHFDVAVDLGYAAGDPDRRVNLGGAPGEDHDGDQAGGTHPEPYLYVGPWTAERPGDPGFWNAPFGARLTRREIADVADPLGAAVAFFRRGLEQLGLGLLPDRPRSPSHRRSP